MNAAGPSPERIFTTLNAFHQTAALKAGIELDIFTAIDDGGSTPAAIAAQSGASERGIRILCDSLTVLGFLEKQEASYFLTPESRMFLSRKSRACIGSISGFVTSDWSTTNFAHLTDSVRKGGKFSGDGANTVEAEIWTSFAKCMAPLTVPAAMFIAKLIGAEAAKPCRVLDIAAGHGMYGITIARQNPNARITALDWPGVLEIAKEHAQEAGVAERYETLPGSAFETDFGSGYDVILLTNIFHHFDPPTCTALMKKVRGALKPNGMAITLEFIPNEDRVSPPTAAAFSLVMLASTNAGDAYTESEYRRMFADAGFPQTRMEEVPYMPQRVLISTP